MVSHHDDGSVEFAFYRPQAAQVNLAGDFNDWQSDVHAMRRDNGGWWRIRLALGPGEYRFKYLVDGTSWEADYAAFGVHNDKRFGWTSNLWIAPAARARRAAA